MERTLLLNCRMICPAQKLVLEDALVSFNHINPVNPPDLIGYAGARISENAPDCDHPTEQDAVLDMEGTTILPGLIDLDAALFRVAHPSGEAACLEAYRRSAKALYRGITSVGYADQGFKSEALAAISDSYGLWTPALVKADDLKINAYTVLFGAPAKGTQAEREYLAAVRKAVSERRMPAVMTGISADETVDGYMPLIRAAMLLVEGGYEPMEALAAITCNNAALLGISDRTACLRSGFEGDIIAVEGRPESEIAALANIRLSARGGRLINSTLKNYPRIKFAVVPPGCVF